MTYCLIVDDSKVVRRAVSQIVQSLNFEYEEAADGSEALNSCQRRLPDLILLDWNMPVMDGLEFLVHLRKMPDGNKPKVIFCTSETSFENIQKAMASGADEYVMKPFDRTILMNKLELIGLS